MLLILYNYYGDDMKVTILGAGAYGLALSNVLLKNKNNITVWTPFDEEKKELLETKKSSRLCGYRLNEGLNITTNLEEAIDEAKLIVIAIPTAYITDTCKKLKKYLKKNQYICITSKGIEQDSCLFIHEIIKKQLRTRNVGVISGPSFAVDLINSVPVGLSVASKSKRTLNIIRNAFCNDCFKLYPTNDVIGLEICGALKNIVALASGIIEGMNYPISTQALLITDCMHDIRLLIKSLGGSKETILGFAGFGDILITCTSSKSRNYCYGKMVGSKKSINELEEYRNSNTIEGIYTLKSIYKLINKKNIDIPIIKIIYNIIFDELDAYKLIEYLMI